MIFDVFRPNDVVAIPQNDTECARARARSIEEARERYEWSYEGFGDAAMVRDLPLPEELPHLGWLVGLGEVLIRVQLNGVATRAERSVQDNAAVQRMRALFSDVSTRVVRERATPADLADVLHRLNAAGPARAEGRGATIAQYQDMFNTIKLDVVAKDYKFLRDDVFGWYRVAGPNPMRITRVRDDVSEMFPEITDNHFRDIPDFAQDTLADAAREDRLYYVDYRELDGIPTGSRNGRKKDLYLYAPRCLLAVPKRDQGGHAIPLPVAIHCGQGETFPMYTASPRHTDAVTWIAAKFTVQCADAVTHEVVHHLGRCHLLCEAVLVAMHRTLAQRHPVYRLLKPSFYGTALINKAAVSLLGGPDMFIDVATAPDVAATRALAGRAVVDPAWFNFADCMPDAELGARGVLSDALHYPYRDDALLHWHALLAFVRRYVHAYYASDGEVAGDPELQAFCKEVRDHGRVHGFSRDAGFATREEAVRAVAMVMFTASVQHAALNFPQATLMQFAPAMPFGGAAEAPTTARPYGSVDEWVSRMVPPLEIADLQLRTAETIGVLRYGMVGEYGSALNFVPDEVAQAVDELQEELGRIGAQIQERNARERRDGLPVYNYLVPKNVPMSINI